MTFNLDGGRTISIDRDAEGRIVAMSMTGPRGTATWNRPEGPEWTDRLVAIAKENLYQLSGYRHE